MAIVYNICQFFTGMNAHNVLDHHFGCKDKHNRECMELEGQEKVKKLHKKKSMFWG